MRQCLHNLSSSSHQRVLSISLRTAHERGDARRRCYSIGAVAHCTATVVPKRSRDSVSDDVAFRRPAVELLVVTMHGWALPCHTKSGLRTPSSTSYWLKLYHDVFDASANHISKLPPNFSDFRGDMAFFLVSPKRQIPLTSYIFFFCVTFRACCFMSI